VLFASENSIKEIGIRKILGASVIGLVTMLSKQFIWLITIANIIAVPITWTIVSKWLEHFAFRTPIHFFVFVIVGLLSLSMTLIVIFMTTIKTARANPVETLRYE
jgi:putative ABC transport system permease protein